MGCLAFGVKAAGVEGLYPVANSIDEICSRIEAPPRYETAWLKR
jgi:hypothetical protein